MGTPTILFVDDEINILKTIQRGFMDEGYRIITANSGSEALTMIDGGEKPAVIVSDQRMPEMSGAEFLSQAKERLPDSIRMVLTGYADINAAVDAINRGGIYRYILKPWNDCDLKLAVRNAIERYELVLRNQILAGELKLKNKKLAEFNARLEKMVEERTAQLQVALHKNMELTDALQLKVKELKWRDRIQQLLLTVHPLQEVLKAVLEAIHDVISANVSAIYTLDDKEALQLQAVHTDKDMDEGVFAIGNGASQLRLVEELKKAVQTGEKIVLERQADEDRAVLPERHAVAAVPLIKGDKTLGIVCLIRKSPAHPYLNHEIDIIASYGMQASVAIRDAQLQQKMPVLVEQLDNFLIDFQK